MKPNVFAVKREIDDWGIWYAVWLHGCSNLWTIWVAVCITRYEKTSECYRPEPSTRFPNWTRT